jgi:hypothetical protein
MRRLLVAILALVGLGGPVAAQTMGYADAIQLIARSCEADIERHCATATLANFEIGRCLEQHQAAISPTCAADFVRAREAVAARAAAQASIRQVCSRDIQRLCPTNLVKAGHGHILRCMLKAEPSVGAACNAAITAAGYR